MKKTLLIVLIAIICIVISWQYVKRSDLEQETGNIQKEIDNLKNIISEQKETINSINEELLEYKKKIMKLESSNELISEYKSESELILQNIVSIKSRLDIIEYEEKLMNLKEEGLTEVMIRTLGNLGYTFNEMVQLTEDQIAKIFAPGTHLDGAGFDTYSLSDEKQQKLRSKGIGFEEGAILYNLGYTEQEIFDITVKEVEIIFPNTELVDKLNDLNISMEEINTRLKEGESYKEIIKKALDLK